MNESLPIDQPTPQTLLNQNDEIKKQNQLLRIALSFMFVFVLILSCAVIYLFTQKKTVETQEEPVAQLEGNTQPTTQPELFSSATPLSTSKPITLDSSNWKQIKSNIEVEGEAIGKAAFIVSFSYPTDWVINQTSATSTDEGYMKNCKDYSLSNPMSGSILTIKTICDGWQANYLPYPKDPEIVKILKMQGNDGHTSYWIRTFYSSTNSYTYSQVDTDPEQTPGVNTKIFNELTIGSPAHDAFFIPMSVKIETAKGNSITRSDLKITDEIVNSLKLTSIN